MKQKVIKILVPVDFSSGSANALKHALGFAQKHNIRLTLLHVITGESVFHVLPVNEKANPFDEEKKRMHSLLQKWSSKIINKKVKQVSYLTIYGDAQELILAQMKKIKPHLTIMGSKGAGNSKNSFGSNTASILDRAELPVFTIPEKIRWRIPKKITVATDYNQSDMNVMRNLITLFSPMNPSMTLLHVADYDLKNEIEGADMERMLANTGIKTRYKKIYGFIIFHNNIEEGIKKYITKNKTDLLVMTKIQKNFIEKMMQKNITGHLLQFSKSPLLFFPSPKTEKTV